MCATALALLVVERPQVMTKNDAVGRRNATTSERNGFVPDGTCVQVEIDRIRDHIAGLDRIREHTTCWAQLCLIGL